MLFVPKSLLELRARRSSDENRASSRTLLKDPGILILDEATSALDAANEAPVQQAMAEALKRRPCIVITHRLSTIVRADRIFVIEGGHVAAWGVHEELWNGGACKTARAVLLRP